MKTTKHCRACKSADMLQVETAQDLNVKGVDIHVVGLLSWECPECHAQVETPDQLDHNSALVRAAFLAQRVEHKRLNGLLTGEEIRSFRTRHMLTQKEAAALFGGGPTAFSKYEAEDVIHNASMDKLLRLCINVPENMLRLADMAGVSLSKETLRSIQAQQEKTFADMIASAYQGFNDRFIKPPKKPEISANDEQFNPFDDALLNESDFSDLIAA